MAHESTGDKLAKLLAKCVAETPEIPVVLAEDLGGEYDAEDVKPIVDVMFGEEDKEVRFVFEEKSVDEHPPLRLREVVERIGDLEQLRDFEVRASKWLDLGPEFSDYSALACYPVVGFGYDESEDWFLFLIP